VALYETRWRPYLDRLDALPGVVLLDPAPAFCDETECASIVEGKALYYDDNHHSLDGARRMIETGRARGVLNLDRSPASAAQ
jgi:hypothetical protein